MKSYSLFITKSAAARIFDVPVFQVAEVREYAYVAWVHIKGRSPRFVSKKKFIEDAINFRKQGAESVEVFESDYDVWETDKGYFVSVDATGVVCSCKDYEKQAKAFGRGCCKHGYAVLSQLGFASLTELVKTA